MGKWHEDWHLIVSAVGCGDCGARRGEDCVGRQLCASRSRRAFAADPAEAWLAAHPNG